MSRQNSDSSKRQASPQSGKRSSRQLSRTRGKGVYQSPWRLSPRRQEARVRCLAAINRVRRGESKSLSAAARAEKTTVTAIWELLPAAITQHRPGGRIRVKASDRYSAKVQVLSKQGVLSVTARGSRQRELAGQHRATYLRVLQGKEPPSALKRYRGTKIGGHELISDYELLLSFAQAGDVGQLDSFYVSPDTSA